MNIILVSNRFAKARSVTLTGTHLLAAGILAMCLFLVAVLSAQYAIVRLQPGTISNELKAWLASAQDADQQKQQAYLRQSLDAMAMRLGQMQAQLQRLDGLGARLAKLTGMKPQEFSFGQLPAQGGPYIPAPHQKEVSLESMGQQMASLSTLLSDRSDKLVALETMLLQDRSGQEDVAVGRSDHNGMVFLQFRLAYRSVHGQNAMHEGVDYMVPAGHADLCIGGRSGGVRGHASSVW